MTCRATPFVELINLTAAGDFLEFEDHKGYRFKLQVNGVMFWVETPIF